jgi:hypothetical protein
MKKFTFFGDSLQSQGVKSLLLLIPLVISASLLQAQTPAPAPVAPERLDVTAELPSAPTPTQATTNPSSAPTLSRAASEPAPLPPQPPVQGSANDSNAATWNRSIQDAHQDGQDTQNTGFNSSAGMGSGMRHGGAGGQFSGGIMRSNRFSAPSSFSGDLLPMGDGLTGNLPNGSNRFAASMNSTLPSFNLMRGNLGLPFSSPFESIRISYRDIFTHGAKGMGVDFKNGSASAVFTTAILGNGLLLSLGSTSRVLFTPSNIADGFGVKSYGTPGHSGAKAAIKLSF